jgi:hypothetical protein
MPLVPSGQIFVQAQLTLSGSNTPLLIHSFDYGFTQYTDDTGKPTGYPTGGNISFVVESTSDTTLIDWMLSASAVKSGKIEIGNKVRVIEFKNAVCIQYHESYNHMGGSQPMSISFTISAEEITIDGKLFEQKRKTV